MKRYSIIPAIGLSFFSKDLYRDVASNWKGTGFLYLFVLLAICWIPGMMKIGASVSHFAAKEAPRFLDQIPEITITDGKASINEPMPYSIKDPDTGEVLAIIDTTGTTTSLTGTNVHLLLTKTQLLLKNSPTETRVYDLSQLGNFTLTKERLHHWLDIGRKFLVISLYPICLLGSFVYRIVQALIYAVIGLIFASMLKIQLGYSTLLRLSVIAVTPALILNTALNLAGLRLPGWGLLCFIIAMGYLIFGIKANTAVPPPPVPAVN